MTSDGSLAGAIAASPLRSGGTVSFHHHLRDGDDVMRQGLAACRSLGLHDLHLAASSLFPCHAALLPYLRDGTVSRISTAYMNGPLADAVADGVLPHPVRFQTHGGRAADIVSGRMPVDLAIIAAPAVDLGGAIGGADGKNACGPLGYAMVDAACAAFSIALTDGEAQALTRTCIPAGQVDLVVRVDTIGDSRLVASGTTARAPGAGALSIADLALALIEVSGTLRDGFAFQAGAGATSLAVARGIGDRLARAGAIGGFAAGGITADLVSMHRTGLFRALWNVQSFDLQAVQAYRTDAHHHAMSAERYASPDRIDRIAAQLDVMILGAAEVDCAFNVNVTTTSDGRIIGGSGGHADTAAGARLAIVTVPSVAAGRARIVPRVRCITTPGASIDAVVTEGAIAIPARNADLRRAARAAGLPVQDIADICRDALSRGTWSSGTIAGRVIGHSLNPSGGVIDTLHEPMPSDR